MLESISSLQRSQLKFNGWRGASRGSKSKSSPKQTVTTPWKSKHASSFNPHHSWYQHPNKAHKRAMHPARGILPRPNKNQQDTRHGKPPLYRSNPQPLTNANQGRSKQLDNLVGIFNLMKNRGDPVYSGKGIGTTSAAINIKNKSIYKFGLSGS